jgi:hypothetical protein
MLKSWLEKLALDTKTKYLGAVVTLVHPTQTYTARSKENREASTVK